MEYELKATSKLIAYPSFENSLMEWVGENEIH